ncbi:hypothetical protein, partial [uncultured Dialister sp.]|uniref:hypothetical protein n=1 Tax=uncultured Dialister sp. TaxID=278064 RepID=UPI0026DAFA46
LSLPIKGLTYWLADRARWGGAAPSAPFFILPLAAGKPYNRPAGEEMHPPLVAGATTFPPQAVGLWVLSHGAMPLQESIETYSAP